MAPPDWRKVNWKTQRHGPRVPKLGLEGGQAALARMPHRVYVIRCAPARINGPFVFYVRISIEDRIGERLREEFELESTCADFLRHHQLLQLELVWPLENKAAEATYDCI